MTNFPELVGDEMNVPTALIVDALRLAHVRYRKIHVKKRSGGQRTIVQPAAELKLVLAWLSAGVLSRLPLSPVAAAFRPGASIVKNAAAHRESLYSVRVDIKDFFPSIRSGDLIRVVLANAHNLPPFIKDLGLSDFVRRAGLVNLTPYWRSESW